MMRSMTMYEKEQNIKNTANLSARKSEKSSNCSNVCAREWVSERDGMGGQWGIEFEPHIVIYGHRGWAELYVSVSQKHHMDSAWQEVRGTLGGWRAEYLMPWPMSVGKDRESQLTHIYGRMWASKEESFRNRGPWGVVRHGAWVESWGSKTFRKQAVKASRAPGAVILACVPFALITLQEDARPYQLSVVSHFCNV